MYWEALGLAGSPSSPLVDELAKYIQWAQTGILAGGNQTGIFGGISDNESAIRFNLNSFWSEKGAAWASASKEEQDDMVRLDIYAHGLLEALDQGKVYSSSPSYWEYWRTYVFGGTPRNPDSVEAAKEGFQAAKDASKAAATVGQTDLASFYSQTAKNIKTSVGDAAKQWDQGSGMDFMGIPLWAWGLGIGAGILFLRGR